MRSRTLWTAMAGAVIILGIFYVAWWTESQKVKREEAKFAAMEARSKKEINALKARQADIDLRSKASYQRNERDKKELKQVRNALSKAYALLKVKAELAKLRKLPKFKKKAESLLLEAKRLIARSKVLSLKGMRLRKEGRAEFKKTKYDYLAALKKYKGKKPSASALKKISRALRRKQEALSKIEKGGQLCTQAKTAINQAKILTKKVEAMVAARMPKNTASP